MRTTLTCVAAAWALTVAAIVPLPAIAQSSTAAPGANTIAPDVRAGFSKQIERDLAAQGARVAIVFRSGRASEELPDGVNYTHGAIWVYSTINAEDGRSLRGYAVYNLYSGVDGEPKRSYLHQDFPADFTSVMVEPRAGVIIPTPEMQRRIYDVLASPLYVALHQPEYSLVSNPHDLRFQNCNEFMLDVISAAAWETDDRTQIKTNLTAWFEPTPIATNGFQRFFAPLVRPSVRTADHTGGVKTTTFGSLSAFMTNYDLSDTSYELTYAPDTP